MNRFLLTCMAAALFAALLATPLHASQKPTTPAHKSSTEAVPAAWPPEALTGTIVMVKPAQHLVVVQDASGTPFDVMVTPATRIRSGSQSLNLQDLSADVNKPVTLRFVPERRGDVARSIQITG